MGDSSFGLNLIGLLMLALSVTANAWLFWSLKKRSESQTTSPPPMNETALPTLLELSPSDEPQPPTEEPPAAQHQAAHDLRSPLAFLSSLANPQLHPGIDEALRESIRIACLQLKEVARKIDTNETLDAPVEPEVALTVADIETVESLLSSEKPESLPEITETGEAESVLTQPSAPAPAQKRTRKPKSLTLSRMDDEETEVQLLEPLLESVITRAQEKIGRFIQITWWSGNGFGIFAHIKRRAFSNELIKAIEKTAPEFHQNLSIHVAQNADLTLDLSLRHQGELLQSLKTLSATQNPEWFSKHLQLPKDCQLIILDDDPSIHRLWDMRLQGAPCQILHLRNPEDAIDWYQNHWSEGGNTFWLCDHDLGADARSGLETIELLGIQDESLLITSRFEDPEMQHRVVRQGVRILPKLLAPIAPIHWVPRHELFTSGGQPS